MNMQTVRTTDIQRNFKQVLSQLQAKREPVVVLRDSVPVAVMIKYSEYRRLVDLERSLVKVQLEEILAGLSRRNADVSDAELDKDIKKARDATGRN